MDKFIKLFFVSAVLIQILKLFIRNVVIFVLSLNVVIYVFYFINKKSLYELNLNFKNTSICIKFFFKTIILRKILFINKKFLKNMFFSKSCKFRENSGHV